MRSLCAIAGAGGGHTVGRKEMRAAVGLLPRPRTACPGSIAVAVNPSSIKTDWTSFYNSTTYGKNIYVSGTYGLTLVCDSDFQDSFSRRVACLCMCDV